MIGGGAPACSEQALLAGEPLPGTAPLANFWVVIEQPGSWGAKALRDAPLPQGLRTALGQASSAAGVGVLLARHPDRRVATAAGRKARVWVADVRPGALELRTGEVDDLDELSRWDFAALAAGELPALDGAAPNALLLVCTQGGRDACCARIGRPLLTSLLDEVGPAARELAWEASHIGGHRFAPTVLALPTGAVHGRLDAVQAREVLQATGRGDLVGNGLRGRTCLAPCAQAAELAVRERIGDWHVQALEFTVGPGDAPMQEVVARHRDGRAWSVLLVRQPGPISRAESCGGQASIPASWQVVSVQAA